MNKAADVQPIDLDSIIVDDGTQARTKINQEVVHEYADAILSAAELPPLVVFFNGTKMWLADGHHRWHAAKIAGRVQVLCDVRRGGRSDAIWYAIGANKKHGLRRSNADKRRAVEMALAEKKWQTRADRWIADHIGVSPTFVGTVRSELSTVDSCEKKVGRDGKARKKPKPAEQKADDKPVDAIKVNESVVVKDPADDDVANESPAGDTAAELTPEECLVRLKACVAAEAKTWPRKHLGHVSPFLRLIGDEFDDLVAEPLPDAVQKAIDLAATEFDCTRKADANGKEIEPTPELRRAVAREFRRIAWDIETGELWD